MGAYTRNAEIETEFDLLITLMADMVTAQAKSSMLDQKEGPDWSYSLHDLSLKLVKHLYSTRALLEPSGFQTATLPPYGYIDHSSVAVLARSSIENYLVMYWLFSRGDESLREFRYTVWKYCGWKKRAKTFVSTNEALESRQSAIDDAAELLPAIQASPHYQKYSDNQKRSLRKGKWDVDWHWNDLAVEAGLHRTYFNSIYPYLCGYAHSDYISSLQIGQATRIQDQYDLGLSWVLTNLMIIGHFTHFYATLFPAAKAVFEASVEARNVAEKWYLKAEDVEFIYGPATP